MLHFLFIYSCPAAQVLACMAVVAASGLGRVVALGRRWLEAL